MTHILKNVVAGACVVAVLATGPGCSSESKRQRHVERANSYFEKNDYQKAEIEYLNAARLSKVPDPHVVKRLGLIYQGQGRTLEAHQVLTKAKELDGADLETRYALGSVKSSLQQNDAARAEALFILEKKPDHAGAPMLLVDAAQTVEQRAAAREKLTTLAQGPGKTWATHVGLAQLLLQQSNFADAEKELAEAAKLNAKAPEVQVLQSQIARSRNQGAAADSLLAAAMTNAPAHSPQKLQLAVTKMQAGDNAAAKKLLDEVLKESPDYMPAWSLKGRIALAESDYPECERIAQTVLAWNPRSYDMRLLRARTLALKGESAKALTEFVQLDGLYPNVPEVKYETAIAHVQLGSTTDALKSLDEVLQVNPGYAPAILLRAELKLRSGGIGEAITAMLAFQKAQPDNAQAKLILAKAYSAMGQLDQASSLYAELAKEFPNQPELPAYIGFIHFRQGNYAEARKYLESSLKINPLYVAAAEELIDIDIEQKNLAEAQRRANEQLALHTNAPAALMLAAKVALAKGETNTATRLLREVAKQAPEAGGVYVLLAQLESASGNVAGGVEQFKKAVEKNPGDVTAQLQLGMAYDAIGDYVNARKQYEIVVKLNPGVGLAWNNLAYILAERFNELEPAVAAAAKAREIQPADPDTTDTVGWIYFRKGDYPQALNLLREASARRANVPEVIYHLARAEYAMGLEDAARASFQKVIALKAPTNLVQEARQRLAVLESNPEAQSVITLEAAVRSDPSDYLAAVRLGQAYEVAGQYDKAALSFERATKLNAGMAVPWIKLAVVKADRLGNLPEGVEAAKTARKLAPNDTAVAGILGRLSYANADYPVAVALLQENTKSSAPDGELLYELALAYASVGQVERARASMTDYLSRATASRSASAKDLGVLLDVMEGKSAPAGGESIATARLAKTTNDVPALVVSGLALEKAGKPKEAAQRYEQALALNKSLALVQRQLAFIYAGPVPNDDRALELGNKAKQTYDRDAALAKALGQVAYRKGDYRAAVTALSQATALVPKDGEALLMLGLSHEKLEKVADARKAFTATVAAAPGSPAAADAEKALQRLK
jgi:tetratricopeptide (TPR) repeat protein